MSKPNGINNETCGNQPSAVVFFTKSERRKQADPRVADTRTNGDRKPRQSGMDGMRGLVTAVSTVVEYSRGRHNKQATKDREKKKEKRSHYLFKSLVGAAIITNCCLAPPTFSKPRETERGGGGGEKDHTLIKINTPVNVPKNGSRPGCVVSTDRHRHHLRTSATRPQPRLKVFGACAGNCNCMAARPPFNGRHLIQLSVGPRRNLAERRACTM